MNPGNAISTLYLSGTDSAAWAGDISQRKDKLKQVIDEKTRKLLKPYRAFDREGDEERLYFPRKTGGNGLISVEVCVNIEIASVRKCVAVEWYISVYRSVLYN